MDLRVSLACRKAIKLCNYMLQRTNDSYVREEKNKLERLIMENRNERSIDRAIQVSRYIRNNFDSIRGENVILDINNLLSQKTDLNP